MAPLVVYFVRAIAFGIVGLDSVKKPWSLQPEDKGRMTALRTDLAPKDGNMIASFSPKELGEYEILLRFPDSGTDGEMASLITQAIESGRQSKLDLEWQIRADGVVVAKGSGRGRPVHEDSKGGLYLGYMYARQVSTYQLDVTVGRDFERFLRARPYLEVHGSSAAYVRLAWTRGFHAMVSAMCFLIAIVFAVAGLRYLRRARSVTPPASPPGASS